MVSLILSAFSRSQGKLRNCVIFHREKGNERQNVYIAKNIYIVIHVRLRIYYIR